MASLNEQWQEIKDRYGPIFTKLLDLVKSVWEMIAPTILDLWEKILEMPIWWKIWEILAPIIKKILKFVRKSWLLLKKEYKKFEKKLSPTQKKIFYFVLGWSFRGLISFFVILFYWWFINIPTILIDTQRDNFFKYTAKANFIYSEQQAGRLELNFSKDDFKNFIENEFASNEIKVNTQFSEDPAITEVRIAFQDKDIVNIFEFLISLSKKGILIKDFKADNLSKSYSALIGI